MASEYSGDLKCVEIEPVYFSENNRVEWRLPPNKLYTNTMSVMNLAVTKSDGGGFLNKLVGVYGTLNRVSLVDGNVELQTLTRANEWLGVKQHLHSNRYNENLGYNYCGNHKSVRLGLRDLTKDQANGSADKRAGANGRKIIEGGERDGFGEVDTTNAATFKGQLDVSECLNLLQQIPYVDTSVFKNLKLVIEFNVSMTNVMGTNQNTGVLKQQRPYLVVEEIVAEDILAGSLGRTPPAISYNVIESDVFTVPAFSNANGNLPSVGTPNPVQELTFHVSSFNNKKVNRLLIASRCLTATTDSPIAQQNNADCAHGVYNSHAMLKQKNQVRVNGRNVFARNGIEKDMQRLALMADVWGGSAGIGPFYAGLAPLANDANPRQDILQQGNEVIGTQDYFGCTLAGSHVEDLQFDYSRTGTFNGAGDATQTIKSKYNADLSLHIFGEVKKAIVFGKNGQYNVVYQ